MVTPPLENHLSDRGIEDPLNSAYGLETTKYSIAMSVDGDLISFAVLCRMANASVIG
jgi:hypothetical protein